MTNWLEKFVPRLPQGPTNRNLSVDVNQNRPLAPGQNSFLAGVPNASLIYGAAASALFVIALCFVFRGRWITGFLIMLPAGCFLGYALHFLKYPR